MKSICWLVVSILFVVGITFPLSAPALISKIPTPENASLEIVFGMPVEFSVTAGAQPKFESDVVQEPAFDVEAPAPALEAKVSGVPDFGDAPLISDSQRLPNDPALSSVVDSMRAEASQVPEPTTLLLMGLGLLGLVKIWTRHKAA